jgi:DNA-binding XRE family transcriptional regulator
LIYEKDLDESIARYQGEVNPSIETCRKLAACLIVKRELFGEPERLPEHGYSYAAAPVPVETHITYTSDTDFSRVIDGRRQEDVWPIIDELMSTVQVLMPRLYDGVMRKLQ